MKGSLTVCILKYLDSPPGFRSLSANQLYCLLLLSSTSLLIASSSVVSFAAPPKIAQAAPSAAISRPTLKVGSQGERVSELQAALKLLGFYSGTVDGVYNENTANAVSRFKQAVGLNPDGVADAATWQKLFPKEPASTSNTAASLSSTTVAKPEPRPANPKTRATQVPTLAPEPRPVNRKTPTTQRKTPARPSSTITFRKVPGIQYTAEGYPILRLGMSGEDVLTLQKQLQRVGFLSGGIDGDFGRTTETAVKALQRRYGLEEDGVAGGATWDILLRRSPGQR
ncbi:peptidoglycan binding domain-containing protein [Anabaenopsis circularis NIES-21]|uniref:Peptidoglycan binding domain-containing protein n=1 Tax=Anabaenopsis circularis NIES-21 TaxID=1085406 RepID=A0A1Z4GKV4_9CYAN|nr:peptidoglycan-binding protein [Nostoc cycadae]BAY18143.1 peptidoglycan binding domain-containing protein [Anabaenopsis circularis NIES-21]